MAIVPRKAQQKPGQGGDEAPRRPQVVSAAEPPATDEESAA
ncbi:hypothetical protein [Streptomyces ureilyticus]|nr:hypothetical protein [Streptomyces ureilyticus]